MGNAPCICKDNGELVKLQFDYGWKYFDFHAKQRTTMLSFFFVGVAFLANALVSLLEIRLLDPAAFLAFAGFSISLGFLLLDFRNSKLVNIAEDLLIYLEEQNIFGAGDICIYKHKETENKKKVRFGILFREQQEGPWCLIRRHSFSIRAIEVISAAMFLATFVMIKLNPDYVIEAVKAAS